MSRETLQTGFLMNYVLVVAQGLTPIQAILVLLHTPFARGVTASVTDLSALILKDDYCSEFVYYWSGVSVRHLVGYDSSN